MNLITRAEINFIEKLGTYSQAGQAGKITPLELARGYQVAVSKRRVWDLIDPLAIKHAIDRKVKQLTEV